MFVAVVYDDNNGYQSRRPDGDYACFLADTEEDAVEKALVAKRKWDGYKDSDGNIHIYKIIVGEIDQVVKFKNQYKLEEFSGEYGF